MTQPSYDDVPYPDLSFDQTHPERLAMIGQLFGMQPPPVIHCRVLELGCAGGSNLIPIAHALPDSEFVGIDLSARQIAAGQAMADALGLKNMTFKAMNILDVGEDLGQFDYILAHGVYSWVPSEVRQKILSICEHQLTAQGVAYISYTTYPGAHFVGAVRDMMIYHTRDEKEPLARAAEAKDFLNFLADSVPPEDNEIYGDLIGGYPALLEKQRRYIMGKPDAFLLHDELGDVNDAIYFHQFVAQAEQHRLQYLGESNLAKMLLKDFPPPVAEYLTQAAHSLIEMEQYLDFLRNQTFRQTLLCRQEVALDRRLTSDAMLPLYVGSRARLVTAQADMRDGSLAQFRGPDGRVFSTTHPVSKAAFFYLAEITPRNILFSELLSAAREYVYGAQSIDDAVQKQDAQQLAANLLQAYCDSAQLIDLHSHLIAVANRLSKYPSVSQVVRYQAEHGSTITNLRHEFIALDPNALHLRLLPYLDGKHDRAALLDVLTSWTAEGKIGVRDDDGKLVTNTKQLNSILDLNLDAILHWITRESLLVS